MLNRNLIKQMKIKSIALSAGLLCGISMSYSQEIKKDSIKTKNLEEIVISSTRAGKFTPVAYHNVKKKELEARNLGQDIPFMLNMTPSLVSTSDAGTGIGYTGLWIRGSDPTRVNITINGIPYNDPESHGTFWVNLQDFGSALNSIQIQRGVGTSTNGSAAFGASVNLETSVMSQEAFTEINNTIGSFGTRKHNIIINSGLIDGKFSFEGKLAKIASDGFIDRATSDLQSYFLTGSYVGKNTFIKALAFGGKEITYQSWYGTPEAVIKNDKIGIQRVIDNNFLSGDLANNLLNDGRTFNWYTYDNEVDNYNQDHYQLHISQIVNSNWTFNTSIHYTKGGGYFEQFRASDDLSDYGLSNVEIGSEPITESDIIRRRWLDNDFYGFTYGINYENSKVKAVLGGGYNYYDGDHFGEVIWAQYASNGNIRHRYYDNVGTKKDFNTYLKVNYQLNDKINLFGDAQIRKVDYITKGIDNDLRNIDLGDEFTFFNPKVGFTYTLNNTSNIYASYSIGNREPNRNDFLDSPIVPKHETLRDLEIGYKLNTQKYAIAANFFHMNYKNQLVLTGELNDVGSSIRTNVDKSHRTGIELTGGIQIIEQLNWTANLTFSQNKISDFNEVLYDYGAIFDEYNVINNGYKDTDIAYSPNVIANSTIAYQPIDILNISLLTRYVGEQFLDNTSNSTRKIDGYFVNDLQIGLNFKTDLIKEIGISLLINNILDHEYESNGYTFGYFAGNFDGRENYLYPQAGRNILAALKLRF
jgi:iron complex outermembrane receptor protein